MFILKSEYNGLKDVARYHANLRQNLINGGVSESTIALLSSDESRRQQEEPGENAEPFVEQVERRNHSCGTRNRDAGGPLGVSYAEGDHHKDQPQKQQHRMTAGATERTEFPDETDQVLGYNRGGQTAMPAAADSALDDATPTAVVAIDRPHRIQYERMATRTVLLYDLAEKTNLADVTDAVRGGVLLDVFLRSYDRSVQVSFLHAESARAFFDHVRRHDLYIRQKRVSIRWSDRQFVLPGHVANKIGNGATRNLVIRRCDSKVTEESIRDDLEHIHNLAVVRVTFDGGSCFIQTNSVNNAIFARTCMMSRYKYKGSKIEWDTDACEAPLETFGSRKDQLDDPPAKRALDPTANRFQLLGLDGTNDETDEDGAPVFQLEGSARMVV
ncbi:hypothetical protein ACHAQA_001064 [Verticillium albo-atrum]